MVNVLDGLWGEDDGLPLKSREAARDAVNSARPVVDLEAPGDLPNDVVETRAKTTASHDRSLNLPGVKVQVSPGSCTHVTLEGRRGGQGATGVGNNHLILCHQIVVLRARGSDGSGVRRRGVVGEVEKIV